MRLKEVFTKKRTCALLIVLVLILQMFSPYSVLMNKSYAAEPSAGEPYFELAIHPIDASGAYKDWDEATSYYYYDYDPATDTLDTYSGTRVVLVDLVLKGSTTVNSAAISLKYDSTKMTPSMEVNVGTKKNPIYEMQDATDFADFLVDGTIWDVEAIATLDTSTSTFRLDGGSTTGDIAENTVIMTMVYKLADGVTLQDLSSDVFTLVPGTGLTSGLEIPYVNSSGTTVKVEGDTYLLFDGFAAGTKKVDNIAITTMPSKTQYYTGETLDYTGGEIKVTYDDASEETILIPNAIANGTLTASSTVATSSKKVTLTYDGKTTDFEYYLLDSLSVCTPLSNMNYEHGDTINFAGGELTATYVNSAGATVAATLNIANELAAGTLSVDRQVADVDNQTITFTYYDSKTASMTLTVTDPITSISITTQPTTLTYSDGDTISLAGGIITPITKSGKTATTVATDDVSVTASTTTASIAQATNKWVIAGGDGLEAGNQTITLTYEGKTADYTIVVNDTVASLSITTQPTAKNKLGTASTALSFAGIVATIQTSGGASFTVGESSLTIDRSSYNANSLSTQSFPVRYGTVNSSNNAEITLSNYITGISVSFTNTEFDYGTPLSTVLSSGTYTENYADGTSSSAKAISSSMVTGYNASPAAALFGADHTYAETLTITLSSSSNSFDQLPATATQAITIKDVVDNITILNKPSKISYNYGDSFVSNGGQINVNYKSGNTTTVSMGNSAVSLTETDGSTINMNPAVSEFVNGKATKTIKVTYTDGTNTYNTSFNITIKDEVSSIVVTTDPTLTFEHGDTFNADGGKLTVTYASTRTEVIDLDEATLTETDDSTINMTPTASEYTNNSLTKTIKVVYGSKDITYTITIKNTVDSIAVTAPTTTNYNLNDSTSLAGGEVVVTRKAGNTENVALTDSRVTVTNFGTSVAGTNKTANVKYTEDGKDYTGTFNYSVANAVTGVTITAPTKTTYNHGDSLDLTGGTITITYADATTMAEPITSATITEADGSPLNMSPAASEFGVDNTMSKTLKMSYTKDGVTGTQNYTITIVNDVRTIAMHSTNHKVEYNVNDTLDLTNAEILVTRAVGTPEVVSVTSSMVTGFNSSVENTSLPLTVSYTENGITKTTTYNVEVKDTVTAVVIKTTPKTVYKYNETLDVSLGEITVTKGSGNTDIPMTSSMVTGFDSTVLGEQTLTVTYGGQTATYKVNIKDYVTGISVNPSTVNGNYNDELSTVINDNAITYTVTYAKAGAKTPVALAESMVTGYSKTSTTAQNLTVTYTDSDTDSATNGDNFTDTLNVTLLDEVSSITIKTTPKTEYKYNETLDVSSGEITVTKPSGVTDIPMTSSMVTGFVSTALGEQTLTVTYGGQTTTYKVNVKDYVTGISVNPASITGTVNDELSTLINNNTITYTVTYAKAGAKTPVALAESMVTGYSKTSTTAQSLTVTYTDSDTDSATNGDDFTDTLNVTLTNSVSSIAITVPTKTAYEHGDSLDLTGGKIVVTFADGTTQDVTLTQSMITETATGSAVNMSPAATEYNSSNEITKGLKIEYSQGGVNESATYNITIVNSVDEISIATSPKTSYKLNESTTNVGGTITITRKAGNTETVNITDAMVSGLDTTAEATSKTATVTYTEGTVTKTTTYTYSVVDAITGISIKDNPDKTTYGYTDTIDLTGGQITITKESGNTEDKSLTDANVIVTEADGTAIDLTNVTFGADNTATKTIKVSYGGKDTTFNIKVVNRITQIAIKQNPKTSYKIGDSLDLSTGTIEVTRQDGTKEEIALNNSNISVTGFDSTLENTNLELTVKYTENGETKQTTYNVSVVDVVSDVQISTTPKTSYKYGESLDVSTGVLTVTRSSGIDTVNITPNMVTEVDGTPFDSTILGTRNLKVTYGGIERTYEITVSDYVTNVLLTPPTKVTYEYGESLDLTGGTVQKVMASGQATTPVDLSDASVTIGAFDSTQIGAQTIDVTYEGITKNFAVMVEDNIQSIAMKQNPTKVTYKYGEALDVTGGIIEATRSSLNKSDVTITPSMVTGYNPNQLGTQTLTVTYNNKTTTYDVTVEDYVTDISITKPTKLIYKLNEAIDLTGGKVNEIMASGASTTPIDMSHASVTVSGFNSTAEGAITITVSYKGFTKTFGITVVDPLSGVVLKTLPNKTDYLYGESLNLAGATLEVTKESGAIEIVNVTSSMISGYNPNKLGNQTVTITYEGFTQDFIVNVEDYVSNLKITKPNKVEYEYGKSLELDGGKVSIMMASGAIKETVDMTASMVSGFDGTKEGTQTINVEYKDLQGNFQVKVIDKVKGISLKSEPNKTSYKYGAKLDLTGAVITVVKSSGIYDIDVSNDMVSGYKSKTPGTQVITITYSGFTTEFVVKVGNKPVTPTTPVTPVEPETPVTPDEPTTPEIPEEPTTPVEPEKPTISEKPDDPTQNKDEKNDLINDETKAIAGIICILLLFFLLLLIFLKRNVKVYVIEDDSDEYVLGGLDKINSKNPKLDIDKFLDDETYPNKVKIHLNDSISEKLDGKELEIKHRGNTIKHKVKYEDKPYEFELEAISKKETKENKKKVNK